MIRAYRKSRKGLTEDKSISGKPVFIDCVNPTQHELKEISSRYGIKASDMDLAKDNSSRPLLLDYDGYSMVIFGSAFIKKARLHTTSFGFFIFKNMLITIRQDDLPSFKRLREEHKDKFASAAAKGPVSLCYLLIDLVFDNFFRITDSIEDEITKLESHVFENPDETTVRRIFRLKKELIYVYKSLVANREVIAGIQKGYVARIGRKDIKMFFYVYNDATELVDVVGTYKDLLTSTLEMYMSAVSNRMNDVMKKLTVVASFVLIPTLISGIYGMNFEHMPELSWPYGYAFALGVMVISILLMYAYFVQKKYV